METNKLAEEIKRLLSFTRHDEDRFIKNIDFKKNTEVSNFEKHSKLLNVLLNLIVDDDGDGIVADRISDEMDEYWYLLTDDEKLKAEKIAENFFDERENNDK